MTTFRVSKSCCGRGEEFRGADELEFIAQRFFRGGPEIRALNSPPYAKLIRPIIGLPWFDLSTGEFRPPNSPAPPRKNLRR